MKFLPSLTTLATNLARTVAVPKASRSTIPTAAAGLRHSRAPVHAFQLLGFTLASLAIFLTTASVPAADAPALFRPGTRILFQGDSITDGNRGRSADPNHILGHGYAFIIAAKFGGGFPELKLDFMNRGISGNTVLDLEKRWQKDTLDLKPDILSVLIGVNDNGRNVPLDQFEQVYDKLLTDTRAANPKIQFVLCEPFGLPVGKRKENCDAWMSGINARRDIVAKLAKKHHAPLVRFQRAFDDATRRAPAEHWIWDSVHPTYNGHQIMADEWERAVREFSLERAK
jgi:lysophospholipase L1-like esterase